MDVPGHQPGRTPRCGSTSPAGRRSTRRFNVLIDGVTKLSNYDPNVDPGVNKGTMKSFDITSDGTVNIDFTHVTGNPEVNAVEIVNNSVGSNATVAERHQLRRHQRRLAGQRQHRHLRLDQRPQRRDGRPHAVLRPDRRAASTAAPFDGVSFGDRDAGQPLPRPALEHRRDRQRRGRPDLRRRAADLVHAS